MTKQVLILSGIIFLISLVILAAFSLWIFRSNMVKPAQPDLTKIEAAFFHKLQERCNCNVVREVDPRAKVDSLTHTSGSYFLEFQGIKCDVLNSRDSLHNLANRIARALHFQILTQNFAYDYAYIYINFTCNTGEMSNSSLTFDFKPGELKR